MIPTLRTFGTGLLCLSLFFTSCIREEEANTECDIETATLQVDDADSFFETPADRFQTIPSTRDTITFNVKGGVDRSALAPTFTITPKATITPASGTVLDFSGEGQWYTVRSEDRRYSRRYLVRFVEKELTVKPDTVELNFEGAELEPAKNWYYQWIETNGVFDAGCWATGNPGFRKSKSTAKPDDYPTVPWAEGVAGKGVKLETRSTLPFGNMIRPPMPIAAGNLFLGSFNSDMALIDAMKATEFGVLFTQEPLRFTGYYRYTPGETYKNRAGKVLADSIDKPDIYAVLYLNRKTVKGSNGQDSLAAVVLHGDDVLSNDNIVAVARITYTGPSADWVAFDVPFVYRREFDPQVLLARGYNLTVVASSSREGASFCGAVGSTLLIDEFRLICKNHVK